MAKEPEAPEKQEEQEQPATKNGAKSLVVGIALLAALVVGSASAAVVIASLALRPAEAVTPAHAEPEDDASADPSETSSDPVTYEMEDPLIVNVRDTQQRRFLSVKPVFTVASAKDMAALQKKEVELKHILITVLKSKTLEQLDDPQIANTLSREIQEQLNAKLDVGKAITKVQFTQLVVQ